MQAYLTAILTDLTDKRDEYQSKLVQSIDRKLLFLL